MALSEIIERIQYELTGLTQLDADAFIIHLCDAIEATYPDAFPGTTVTLFQEWTPEPARLTR
jgi:hypothetical protein